MVHQFVLQKIPQHFVCATMLQSSDPVNKLSWDNLVVAHAHLNGGEDAEVVPGEVAQGVHVELHGVLLLPKLQPTGQ